MNKTRSSRKFLLPFLHRLDEWLLVHFPLVWRTRVLYFVVYSLILGNLFLFLLGTLVPMNTMNVWTESQVSIIVLGFRIFLLIPGLLWLYDQYRFPQGLCQWKSYWLTGLIYVFCLFCLFLNSNILAISFVKKIGRVAPDSTFFEEYKIHESYNFWICTDKYEKDSNKIIITVSPFTAIWKKYGFRYIGEAPVGKYPESMYKEPIIECENAEAIIYPLYYSSLIDINPWVLREKIQSIRNAKVFKQGEGNYYKSYVGSIPKWLIGFIFFSLFLLVLFQPKFLWEDQFYRFRSRFSFRDFRLWQPKVLQKLDNYLIKNHPILWSAHIHTYGFFLFFYLGLFFGLVLVVSSLIGFNWVDFIDSIFEGANDAIMVSSFIFMAIIPFLISLNWVIKQYRTKAIVLSFISHLKLVGLYFLTASILPICLLLLFWIFLPGFNITGSNFEPVYILFNIGIGLLASWVYCSKYTKVKTLFQVFTVLIITICFLIFLGIDRNSSNMFLLLAIFYLLFFVIFAMNNIKSSLIIVFFLLSFSSWVFLVWILATVYDIIRYDDYLASYSIPLAGHLVFLFISYPLFQKLQAKALQPQKA